MKKIKNIALATLLSLSSASSLFAGDLSKLDDVMDEIAHLRAEFQGSEDTRVVEASSEVAFPEVKRTRLDVPLIGKGKFVQFEEDQQDLAEQQVAKRARIKEVVPAPQKVDIGVQTSGGKPGYTWAGMWTQDSGKFLAAYEKRKAAAKDGVVRVVGATPIKQGAVKK